MPRSARRLREESNWQVGLVASKALTDHVTVHAKAAFDGEHYRKPDDFRDFAIIRTKVEHIGHSRPMGYRTTEVSTGGIALER